MIGSAVDGVTVSGTGGGEGGSVVGKTVGSTGGASVGGSVDGLGDSLGTDADGMGARVVISGPTNSSVGVMIGGFVIMTEGGWGVVIGIVSVVDDEEAVTVCVGIVSIGS